MVKFVTEISDIRDFDFWSGACSTVDKINNSPSKDNIWDYFEQILECSSEITETSINDIMWFDFEDMLVEDGYVSYETEDGYDCFMTEDEIADEATDIMSTIGSKDGLILPPNREELEMLYNDFSLDELEYRDNNDESSYELLKDAVIEWVNLKMLDYKEEEDDDDDE